MSGDRDDEVREAEADMDDTAREMEHHRDEVERDIAESRRELEELRDRQGAAAEGIAGDWHETEDEAGGEDASGAGGGVDVERER